MKAPRKHTAAIAAAIGCVHALTVFAAPAATEGLRHVGEERIVIDAKKIKDALTHAQEEINRALSMASNAVGHSAWDWEAFDFDATDNATMLFLSSELGESKALVKNAPYSAEAVSETVQVLSDGNRITRKTVAQIVRDSEGRTRQEYVKAGRSRIYIHDPVAKKKYLLNPERKTATALPSHSISFNLPKVQIEPGQVIIRRQKSNREGDKDEVHTEAIRIAPGEWSSRYALPMGPGLRHGFALSILKDKGVTADLGTREFDGIRAQGTSVSYTIEAGKLGNERPIKIVSERWYSPELQVVVLTRQSDPRFGETSYRLANIKRGEPAASLFAVPSDYALRDSHKAWRHKRERDNK